MVRFATIGTGSIVESFLAGAALVEGLCHAAVYSRDEGHGRAFAQRHGVQQVFTCLEELARSPLIDAVYIASPNSLHYAQSMIFLENGKHVLCEKPISVREGDAAELLDAARKQGVVFMEAYIPLHLPQLQALKDAVGRVGKISLARFDFSQYSSKYPDYLAGGLPNIFNPAFCTGALMDLGIYCVYPAVLLFGRPRRILASASFLASGADGSGSVILDYPDMQAAITYSKTGQSRAGCEIIGSEGTITIGSISKLENMRLIPLDGETRELSGIEDKGTQMGYEARSFCACIQGFDACAGDYQGWSEMCRAVSGLMYEIRQAAGIRFPGDSF